MSEEQQNQQYTQGYQQQHSQQQYYQPQQYNYGKQQGYQQGQYQQQMYGQQQYQQNQYGYGGRQYQQSYYQNQGPYYQQDQQQQQYYQQYPQQGGYNQPKRFNNYKKYDQPYTQAPSLEELRAKYQPLSQVNLSSFNPDALINDEFVIMRSASLQHIHKATKYGVWTSTSRTNEKLNNIYEQCKSLKKDVYLLFTLVNSHAFQAVGKLIGPFDPANSFLYWDVPFRWLGTFPIQWIYIHEIPQDTINKQIAINFPNQNNIIFTDQIDCTQIAQAQQGILILNCFKEFLSLENRFLQRFPELDEQEEIVKNQRDSDPQFLQKQEEVQAIFLQNPFAFQAPSKPKKNNNRFMPSPDQMMLMQAQHFAQQQQYQQTPYGQQGQYNQYVPQYKQPRQDNQQRQVEQEEFKQQKIDERFFITQGKKQQQQRKQLKIKKRDTKFDYQQDPNAVILQQQEDDSDNSQNEQNEQTQEQQ